MPPLQTMEAKFVPKDTQEVLGKLPVKDCSRSLYFDRYARPDAVKEKRHAFFTEGFKTHTDLVRLRSWAVASGAIAKCGVRFYAQLQSRLMVNMSGGVMENAGLCLDRYGLPYIPGSAVKGCARRAALAALNEWCETSEKPSDADNLFSRACESFAEPFDMLAAIARVFGWCEQDWAKNSDFAWATGKRPDALSKAAVALAGSSGRAIAPEHAGTPWKSLPNSAGGVAFLSAHPVELPKGTDIQGVKTPAVGELELDVVTCHHPEYYQGERTVATDDEDPNPVVFPAVAAGHVFGFVLRRLRCVEGDLRHAEAWLRCGLGTFGLGAKTAAGYGWFDAEPRLDSRVQEELARAGLKADPALLEEFARWDDKQVRRAVSAFAFLALVPKDGREATPEYQFTLAKFVIEQRTKLFLAEKNHARSDFANGIKRLANIFQLGLS